MQTPQPKILKTWRSWNFLFKKPCDFSQNQEILKSTRKIRHQTISLLVRLILENKGRHAVHRKKDKKVQ